MIGDEGTAYACGSIGIGRWYWVVWASEADARAMAPALASGYEKSSGAAEAKAVEAAGPHSKRLPARWATGYKRGGDPAKASGPKPKSRLSRPVGGLAKGKRGGPASSPPRLAFLYAAAESDRPEERGEVVVVRHRIVRQTAGKIHIDRDPFREDEWRGRDGDGDGPSPPADAPKPRTLAVDRETLRREGRFDHRGLSFYASEDAGIRGVHAELTARHGWCAALGVKFPCSVQSIKAAYRRLARKTHPDAGGDPSAFRALERAYREALAYFSATDEPAGPDRG
ncbi:DnaJ domain-containing protein [Aquisphaera insulae]|uniref:DnaJ domain-containing protein n=1 Tax=Aquisphaera insulae TaxID=2712864 RepID=UPI00196BB111|nr:DnaJ domain-containing protein [Aquisphaera insulae]